MEKIKSRKIIRLSKSCIGNEEIDAVKDVLGREFLGMGSEVERFEQELTKFFNRPAICVQNGTAALQLALQASGISNGDEVLVQSLTYVASFQAISATGAKPVACDVRPGSLTIDIQDAKKRLTPKTKAIMPVHYAGGVGQLDKIYEFATKHGLIVVEDAAHAFGSEFRGNRVGSFGNIACFSFDGIKNITCGEGGCIVTDDFSILQRVRDSRLLGVEKDSEKRFKGLRSWDFDVNSQGWRYHMSNIMAAIGIEQLKRFPFFANRRKVLVKRYIAGFKDNPEIRLLDLDIENIVQHIFPILLPKDIDRNKIRLSLEEKGIQTGIHYKPNHKLSFYKSINNINLSNTEKLAGRILSLPLHPEISENDVDFVVSELLMAISH